MAVTTKEQIMDRLKAKFADDTSDEAIQIIEDVSDTFDDLSKKPDDGVNWEEKYKENDKRWREKYRDRFFNSDAADDADDPVESTEPIKDGEEVKTKYEDLFEEVK